MPATNASPIQGGLQRDLSLVLQRRRGASTPASCTGYVGIPAESPALILILAAPTPEAERSADELEQALRDRVLGFSPAVAAGNVPCAGMIANPMQCHAHSVESCRKALVIVGDQAVPVPDEPLIAYWLSGDAYRALPLFPEGASASTLLPRSVRHLNAAFWARSAAERADDVLAVAGLASEDRRVFVSYRRRDALEVAEQLFEEFTKHRFDVFVDRFRVPPGRDVQERLTDELAHKAMVLVLESPTLLESQWVEHELAFAKKHELGRLAVNLPGGTEVPWLDEAYRIRVVPSDLEPPAAIVVEKSRISEAALDRVVDRLTTEHTRALHRRREFMLETLRAALTFHGAADQSIDSRGHLRVRVPISKGSSREYVLWATPSLTCQIFMRPTACARLGLIPPAWSLRRPYSERRVACPNRVACRTKPRPAHR